MAKSMIFSSLELEQVQKLINGIAKTIDHQVGKGPASQALIVHMAEETREMLEEITHKWTHTLYQSYLINYAQSAVRGFYDPGGIEATIFVDPGVVNPVGDKPAKYAAVEFDRGGTHDAFRWVSGNFDDYFGQGMDEFEATLGKALGF